MNVQSRPMHLDSPGSLASANFRRGLRQVAGLAIFLLAGAGSLIARPNFVVVVVDDLGITDLGCYGKAHGNTYHESPNIDRLAGEGMLFTDAYAASAVCSPTRASLMTGKYPARTGITDWIPGETQPKDRAVLGPRTKEHLDLSEVTFAEALKEGGYFTAFIGKWHLGDTGCLPENQGFDVNIGGCHWGHPKGPGKYHHPFGMPSLQSQPGDYLTDRLTDEAIRLVRENKEKPFLLYLAYYTVHTPLDADQKLLPHFVEKNKSAHWKDPKYAAMIKSLDNNLGRLFIALEKEGLSKDTVVLFTSDNGGHTVTSNHPYREHKGDPYEGGTRVPFLVRWPAVVKPGTTCAEPVISTDLYPTLLAIAELPARPEQHRDGLSLLPLLKGGSGPLPRNALFWHYPHFRGNAPAMPAGAIRCGNFKLIERYETGERELYNLAEDIGEKQNLMASMPEKARELQAMLSQWREQTGAVMPQKNPNCEPATGAQMR